MKKTFLRKTTATFLVMIMAVIILPFQAAAAASGTDWALDDDGKLTISSNEGMADWLENGWYYYKSDVKNVEIGDDVTSIGGWAFAECTKLANITIPSSVISIISYAFDGCTSLESIAIPSAVTSIGVRAFRNCTSLKAVTFSADSKLEKIGDSAFFKCTGLESIAIPSSVKIINADAFNGCAGLKTVTFAGPSQLTSIGDYAFENCAKLTNITIPSSVTSIGRNAFNGCAGLKTVTFSADSELESIGITAFENCTDLSSITIPDSVTSIYNGAFSSCSSLKSVTFSANSQLESIGDYAFYDCTSLKRIDIPSSVGSVRYAAFENCTSLETVEFLGNIPPSFGGGVFGGSNVKICYVPYGTKEDYKNALDGNLPDSVIIEREKPVIPDPPSTGGGYTTPQPSVAGGTGWSAVNKSISTATEGSAVAINMNGATDLPKSVLDAVKGKNINLVITMSGGFVWTINGKDIIDAKNIDLTVKKPLTQRIPTNVLNTVTGERFQLYLGFEGDFGFKAVLTVPLGSTNSGRYANLFYYNPSTKKLEYISSGKIGSDGKAGLDFTHASDYVITITSEITTEVKSDSSEIDTSSEANPTTGEKIIPFGVILIIATGAIVITNRKAKRN